MAQKQTIETLQRETYRLLAPEYAKQIGRIARGTSADWSKFQDIFARSLFMSQLIGRATVVTQLRNQGQSVPINNQFKQTDQIVKYFDDKKEQQSFLIKPFKEAIRAFINKVPGLASVVETLAPQARRQAFFISGIENEKALSAIQNSLSNRLQNITAETTGTQVAKMRKQIIDETGVSLSKARLATVVRTNTNQAYNDGHLEQLTSQAVVSSVALIELIEIQDSRTRGNPNGRYPDSGFHWQMDGFMETPENPIWQSITPPNGYNCRGRIASVSWNKAIRLGLATKDRKIIRSKLDARNRAKWQIIRRGDYPDPGFK